MSLAIPSLGCRYLACYGMAGHAMDGHRFPRLALAWTPMQCSSIAWVPMAWLFRPFPCDGSTCLGISWYGCACLVWPRNLINKWWPRKKHVVTFLELLVIVVIVYFIFTVGYLLKYSSKGNCAFFYRCIFKIQICEGVWREIESCTDTEIIPQPLFLLSLFFTNPNPRYSTHILLTRYQSIL